MRSLEGKVAMMCGLSSEFALPLARTLIQHGARLALVDADIAMLPGLEGDVFMVHASLTDESASAAVQTIQNHFGTPDILVVCSPAEAYQPDHTYQPAEFITRVYTSLGAAYLWSHTVAPLMRAQTRGVVVHVTGLAGLGGWPGWQASGAAFAAVHNLVQSLAVEWARDNVRVNALIPGVTDQLAQHILLMPPMPSLEGVKRRIPVGRLMSMDELCHALIYLVNPTASYITGELLRVDGGWDTWGRLHAAVQS